MNLAPFARFSRTRKTNAVWRLIRDMEKHRVFRGSRFDVYSSTMKPQKVVVLLGQMHTVWKGDISNRVRKKIVACQARLCSYYGYFQQVQGVTSFGGEGMYEGLEVTFQELVNKQLYAQVEKDLELKQSVSLLHLKDRAKQMFQQLGKQWQLALRGSDLKKVQHLAASVSGQSLYHYLSDGKAEAYPIEAEAAYQEVLQKISHLGHQISVLQEKPAFRYVKQRGGKVKTPEEAQVIQQYNTLIKAFNAMIGSDIRERATFDILRAKAVKDPVVVFTMGVGHRKNYLKLVNHAFKDTDLAFVFVTPPELLLNYWIVIGVPVLVLVGLSVLNAWLGG